MTIEQVEALIRKYVSTGMAVVVVLIGPATAQGANTKPQVITRTPDATTSAASTTTPSTTTASTATEADPDQAPQDPQDPQQDQAPQDPQQSNDRTTAAAKYGWGTPNRQDDFSGDLSGWGLYDGPGHAGNGRRSPAAATVADGVLTIRGDAQGATEGMAWDHGQKYGRWEGRVKAPASDPTYNALLLLWPDAENFPIGGEVDFMEMTDNTRQSTNVYLHHGAANAQLHGAVKIDATQWHNWAVEWTPKGITTYVDGNPWWHTDDAGVLPPGPMHLCVQLDWFPQGDAAVRPSEMQVDWVRQYPVDGSGAAQSTATPATTTTPTETETPTKPTTTTTTPKTTTPTTTTPTTTTAEPTPTDSADSGDSGDSADSGNSADPTDSGDSRGSAMRDVIRQMFGW